MAPKPKRAALPAPQPPNRRRTAFTMEQAAEELSCSVSTVYRLVADGHLATFLIGRKRYASPRALDVCVEKLEQLDAPLPSESGLNNRTGPGKSNEAPA
jgi:excisionase family DNA binding protein